jgi:hypothetical protein
MDELPPHARALLARARAAEQVSPDAERRVRVAVAAAIGAGTATAAGHASAAATGSMFKGGFFASTAAKLAVAGSLVVALGTTAIVMRSQPSTAAPTAALPAKILPKAQPPVVDVPASKTAAEPEPSNPAADAGAAPMVETQARRRANLGATSSLHDELPLLASASAALEQRNVVTARAALAEHARRFPHGQLAPERRGFAVIEACLSNRPRAAQRARAYVRASSDAVLVARIVAQCDLEPSP